LKVGLVSKEKAMGKAIMLFLLCFSAPGLAVAPATGRQDAQIIAAVKAKLKDPVSAQFRDIKRLDNGNYCGWVNAKNSYGGFTGFSVFYVRHDTNEVVLLTPELTEPRLC
jgi:hypothetical protein